MEGEALLLELAKATGLPEAWVQDELRGLIQKRGLNASQLTMDDLREILGEFMQDTLLKAKAQLAEF